MLVSDDEFVNDAAVWATAGGGEIVRQLLVWHSFLSDVQTTSPVIE